MTEYELQQAIYTLEPYINKLVDRKIEKSLLIAPAVVIEADNNSHFASVRLLDSPDRPDQDMQLMNCTGKDLKTGDNVFVGYFFSLSNAFIAIKNDGLPWGW